MQQQSAYLVLVLGCVLKILDNWSNDLIHNMNTAAVGLAVTPTVLSTLVAHVSRV